MKKLLIIILAATLLLAACTDKEQTTQTPDDTSAAQPQDPANSDTPGTDEPNIPDTPDLPDMPLDPVVPDTPPQPETPVEPTPPEPTVPPQPETPKYPDISGFDKNARTVVYASGKLEMVDPSDMSVLKLDKDHALISLGNAEKYTVILYKDKLYLAETSYISTSRPAVCAQNEAENGGTFYSGGDKVVVIDPGHQSKAMYDKEPVGPGSETLKNKVASGTQGVSTKIAEYVLNLEVSLLLRDELISRGYTVVMVRETHDVRISNAERAQAANAYKADAFIRVHANGSENKNTRGAIAIFQTKDNPWCGALYTQSRLLSETVLDAYCTSAGIENDGNWETDTMTGINWTTVPSTIIELGYMSNAEEDELMATKEFRKNAAIGIASGIDNYFTK